MGKDIEIDEGWKDTYSDLVTLLMCFFVLLFSQATIEDAKWEKLIQAFQNPTDQPQQIVINPTEEDQGNMGASTGGEEKSSPSEAEEVDLAALATMIQEMAAAAGQSDNVAVSSGDNMVFIRFKNDLLFDGYSSVLKSAARDFLSDIGGLLKEHEDKVSIIRVNGHTAAVTTSGGSYVSDRLLSSDRANAVLMYLEDVVGIEPKKLIAIGYGKNYPIASNDTEEGRAENRRVELMILGTSDGAADDYWSSIFSGSMSPEDYDAAYQALDKLPSLTQTAEEGTDYSGLGGTTDNIDKIDLDSAGQ